MYIYSHLMVDLKLKYDDKDFIIEGKNKHYLDVREPRFTELPDQVVIGLFEKYWYLEDIKDGKIFYEKSKNSIIDHAKDLEKEEVIDAPIKDEQLLTKKTNTRTKKK